MYLNTFWLVSVTNNMSSSSKHSPRMSLSKACAAKEVSQEETQVFLLAGGKCVLVPLTAAFI